MLIKKSVLIVHKELPLIVLSINVLKKLLNVKGEKNMIPTQKSVYALSALLSMMELHVCHVICQNIGMKKINHVKTAQMDLYIISFRLNVKNVQKKNQ